MSYRYTRSPIEGPPTRDNSHSISSHKRQFSNDDDNTFLPPALSSYSIALLNDRTKVSPMSLTRPSSASKNTNVTGVYDLDFPEKKGSTLKSRLSVHFKEAPAKQSASYVKEPLHADSNSQSNGSPLIESHGTSLAPNDTSASSHHSSFHESHHQSLNSFSANNYSSHNYTAGSEGDLMDEDSPRSFASKTPATTPGSNKKTNFSHNDEGSSTSSSHSNVHTIKRIRGTRRFGKMLGPPKRASRLSDHYSRIEDSHSVATTDENGKSERATPPPFSLDTFLPHNQSLDPFRSQNDSRHTKQEISVFKEPSPEIDLLSKEKEEEFRKRINEQIAYNELQFQASRVTRNEETPKNSFSPEEKPQERIPLSNIPVNSFNSSELDSFRKPKLPKVRKEIAPYQNVSPEQENRELNVPASKGSIETQMAPSMHPDSNQPPIQRPSQQFNHTPSAPRADEHKKKIIIINGNQYEKLELLGRGGTSKVYKVKALANNLLYAIKKVTFDRFDDSCIKGFKGEIDLLLKLKTADRVVKLIDHAIGEGSIYLVMECGDIDLAHVLHAKLNAHKVFDVHFVKYYTIEMLKCVNAVHEAGIVHSDLKPANFLLVRGILKIIDFGIANAVPDHTANIYRESQIGTPNYMAPEALVEVNSSFPGLPLSDGRNQRNTWKVGKPSDVWSCGCIVYQMIYGKPPYGGYSGNQRIMAIMNPQVKISYATKGLGGVNVPQSAIELMQNCLARNPNERWTIDQCLNSDFLKPKIVSESFVRDLVHSAVNYGYNKRINGGGPMTADVYDTLVDSVLKQIENLNYG